MSGRATPFDAPAMEALDKLKGERALARDVGERGDLRRKRLALVRAALRIEIGPGNPARTRAYKHAWKRP